MANKSKSKPSLPQQQSLEQEDTADDSRSRLIRIEETLNRLVETVNAIRLNNDGLSMSIEELKDENCSLKLKIDDLDAYSRLDNLVFSGLTTDSYAQSASAGSTGPTGSSQSQGLSIIADHNASAELAVMHFCKETLKINVQPNDISIAHRLGSNPGSPPTILVRFSSRKIRNQVYFARKILFKNKSIKVYINEHLTKSRSDLFKEARKLVKEKKLAKAWSFNGAIYIRLSDLPNSRPIRVNSLSDLPRG